MTLDRIAELLGTKTDGSAVFSIDLNKYFISVASHTAYRNGNTINNFKMTLVKKADPRNQRIAQETIKATASDNVVLNRFAKLASMI